MFDLLLSRQYFPSPMHNVSCTQQVSYLIVYLNETVMQAVPNYFKIRVYKICLNLWMIMVHLLVGIYLFYKYV